MAHIEQQNFCLRMKNLFPDHFKNKKVLDAGSLDVNGNNRYLFEESEYIGVDVGPGKNVDIVCKIHDFEAPDSSYDTIISTECFEHDQYYELSISNLYRMLKPGGFFIFTCATTGREEHGTRRSHPSAAPLLINLDSWGDYYKNLTEEHIRDFQNLDELYSKYSFEVNDISHDLYFYGIKKGE